MENKCEEKIVTNTVPSVRKKRYTTVVDPGGHFFSNSPSTGHIKLYTPRPTTKRGTHVLTGYG